MTVTHEQCRDALAAQVDDLEVEAHIARCGSCRRFASTLEKVDSLAASRELFPPPAGIADRVVERAPAGEVVEASVGVRSVVRRALVRTAVAAAVVAAVVAAGLVATRPGEDPERMALINAARSVEEEGTAGVAVSGTVEFTVDRQGARDPDFSSLPPELQSYFEERWNEMITQFERQVSETLDRANRMLEDAFDRLGSAPGAPPRPPSPPPAPHRRGEGGAPADPQPDPAQAPPSPPDALSLGFSLEGAGVVDVDGRLQLDGTLRPAGGTIASPGTEARFGIAVVGEARAVRGPDGQVVAIAEAGAGGKTPLARLLTRPGAIPSVLRAARDVETSGTVEAGGERLRRYRFTADGRRAEALLDADGKLRQLVVHDRGIGGQMAWQSTVSFDVTAYGVDASAAGDFAGTAQASATPPAGSAAILYPFGAAVAEALGDRR